MEANQSKLGDVDMLMAKWAGREEELYRNICQKYPAVIISWVRY